MPPNSVVLPPPLVAAKNHFILIDDNHCLIFLNDYLQELSCKCFSVIQEKDIILRQMISSDCDVFICVHVWYSMY